MLLNNLINVWMCLNENISKLMICVYVCVSHSGKHSCF